MWCCWTVSASVGQWVSWSFLESTTNRDRVSVVVQQAKKNKNRKSVFSSAATATAAVVLVVDYFKSKR